MEWCIAPRVGCLGLCATPPIATPPLPSNWTTVVTEMSAKAQEAGRAPCGRTASRPPAEERSPPMISSPASSEVSMCGKPSANSQIPLAANVSTTIR